MTQDPHLAAAQKWLLVLGLREVVGFVEGCVCLCVKMKICRVVQATDAKYPLYSRCSPSIFPIQNKQTLVVLLLCTPAAKDAQLPFHCSISRIGCDGTCDVMNFRF